MPIFITKTFGKSSRFVKKKRGRCGYSSIDRLVIVQKEVSRYSLIINKIYKGLEDLKLGKILVHYKISGFIKKSGKIGRTGPDFKRQIAQKTIRSKYTKIIITAFAYRGYRYKTDHDSSQGKGIAGVMR